MRKKRMLVRIWEPGVKDEERGRKEEWLKVMEGQQGQ